MKSFVKPLVLCVGMLLFVTARAQAIPLLQLDIIGGHYDPVTQTIISSGPEFTLVALLTPKTNTTAQQLTTLLNDTYYVSAAINPPTGPTDSALGSFTWNSTNYNVTTDMLYGTPPIELLGVEPDPRDLAPHSIFPTFFQEFAFQFTPTQTATTYNTQDAPGGLTPATTGQLSYFQTFNITTSLSDTNVLHFDLYNTFVQSCAKRGTCVLDEDIASFAPFSHDAQSSNNSVPEAQSLLLMSTGLLLAGRLVRRRA